MCRDVWYNNKILFILVRYTILDVHLLVAHGRLASLQKNGEEGWRRRIGGSNRDLSSTTPLSALEGTEWRRAPGPLTPLSDAPAVRRRHDEGLAGPRTPCARPTSIADRLSLLQHTQEGWRGRVAEKDATQFTVEGKMSRLGE